MRFAQPLLLTEQLRPCERANTFGAIVRLWRYRLGGTIEPMPGAFDLDHSMRCKGRTRLDEVVAELATRQHGVVARRQLLGLGMHRRSVDHRIAEGRLHPVHRGVYAVGHEALRREGAWMAATLISPEALLSHRSAAALWGIRGDDRARTEITVPRALKRRERLQIHRAELAADEVTTHDRIPVTTAARTLLDLAAILTPQQLERAATEAEIRRLGSPTSLAALVARYPRRPGTPAITELLANRDIGRNITKRELELRFLAFLDTHHLPRPSINHEVIGKEVDCLWPDQRLIVELDGFATHGTRRAFEQDRARDRALAVAGHRVVRITWRHLTSEGHLVADQLRRLLEQRAAA